MNAKTLKTMESNKSKGVEALIKQIRELDVTLPLRYVRESGKVLDANNCHICEVSHRYSNLIVTAIHSLAHPQQSEATLTDHAISIGTPIQTKAAASEGVGELESIINCMDGMEFSFNDSIFSGYVKDLKKWKNKFLSQKQNIIGERPAQPTASNYAASLSHPSEGVEELLKQMAWAAWKSAANAYRMYPDNKHTFTDYWHDLGKAEAENLIAAHPQQSEGVEEPYNNPFYDNFYEGITAEEQAETDRRLISKAEGVGATDSICGDLKDRQAAEGEMVDLLEFAAMNYQPNITSDKQVYWFEDDNETPILSEEIVERYLAEAQPSEPAALKEFYCIGDKDNLFQCEEQCEDCKKGGSPKGWGDKEGN